jgi:hypothetical protein
MDAIFPISLLHRVDCEDRRVDASRGKEDDVAVAGFDFANDLRVLTTSFPFLETVLLQAANVVCLVKLVNNVSFCGFSP